jgi:hypothetical protein
MYKVEDVCLKAISSLITTLFSGKALVVELWQYNQYIWCSESVTAWNYILY